jgi:anthranilate phosphoribosyltransferase
MTTWPEVLAALVDRTDLSGDQTTWAMGEILAGQATEAQIAGFAIGLKAKGETVEEVTGLADAMYAARTPIDVPGRLLDVVGTGGDRSMSVNISTMAAIVAAGAALAVYDDPATPAEEAIAAGLSRARDAVDSGAAAATLERWVAATSA